MDYEREFYVKMYTRVTGDMAAWAWQTRALWRELIICADRATGLVRARTTRAVAGIVRMPVEITEAALLELLDDGCLQQVEGGYLLVNYLRAQGARQADSTRKALSRAVTRSHTVSADVQVGHTKSHEVTDGHTRSRKVTKRREEKREEENREEEKTSREASPSRDKSPPTDHQLVIAAWSRGFEQAHGTKPTWAGADFAQVKRLLGQHERAEIERRMTLQFESPPSFPEQPWSFRTFASRFDECSKPSSRPQPERRKTHSEVLLEDSARRIANMQRDEEARLQLPSGEETPAPLPLLFMPVGGA